MLLKRRRPATMAERVRVALWPRHSWARSLRYVRLRIMRLRTSPHSIALGCAVGVFASCTPLIGGQMILAGLLAVLLRASVPAAMLATFFGNPVSWPVIWAATYAAGAGLVGGAEAPDLHQLGAQMGLLWQAVLGQSPELMMAAAAMLWPFMKPMLAGSLPVGLLVGALIYYMMRAAARAAQSRRRPVEMRLDILADPDATHSTVTGIATARDEAPIDAAGTITEIADIEDTDIEDTGAIRNAA